MFLMTKYLDSSPSPLDSGPSPLDSGPSPLDSSPSPLDSSPSCQMIFQRCTDIVKYYTIVSLKRIHPSYHTEGVAFLEGGTTVIVKTE